MGRFILAIAVSGQTVEVAGAKWNKKAGSEVDKPQSKGFLAITVKPEGDALTLTPDGDVLGGQGGLNATTAAFLEAEAVGPATREEPEPMGASAQEANMQPGKTAAADHTGKCITMAEKLCALQTGALARAQQGQKKKRKHLLWLFQRVNPFLQPLATFYEDHWSKFEGDDGERSVGAKCAFAFLGPSQADQMENLLESIHYEMQVRTVPEHSQRNRDEQFREYRRRSNLVNKAKKLLGPLCTAVQTQAANSADARGIDVNMYFSDGDNSGLLKVPDVQVEEVQDRVRKAAKTQSKGVNFQLNPATNAPANPRNLQLHIHLIRFSGRFEIAGENGQYQAILKPLYRSKQAITSLIIMYGAHGSGFNHKEKNLKGPWEERNWLFFLSQNLFRSGPEGGVRMTPDSPATRWKCEGCSIPNGDFDELEKWLSTHMKDHTAPWKWR